MTVRQTEGPASRLEDEARGLANARALRVDATDWR